MNFKEFLEVADIDFHKLAVRPGGGDFTLAELEVTPMEFLMQAEMDLELGGMSAMLNSITNSKRAIVAQLDQLLLSFGYSPYRWNIPRKLDQVRQLGLMTPAIIRKVSDARNLLEHEYSRPSNQQVEEALDIATIFVLANVALFNPLGDVLEAGVDDSWDEEGSRYGKRLSFGLNRDNGGVYYSAIASSDTASTAQYKVTTADPMFAPLVKLAVAYELKYKIEKAFDGVHDAFSRL